MQLFGINDKDKRVAGVLAQSYYDDIVSARVGALNELNTLVTEGLLFVEFVPIGAVIFKTSDSFQSTVLQDALDEITENLEYDSSGLTTFNAYTDNGNATITLPENDVLIYNNANFEGRLYKYVVPSGTIGVDLPALENNKTNYIVINYNSGSPVYDVTTILSDVTWSDVTPYLTVFRYNNDLSIVGWDRMGNGLANKLTTRLVRTHRFELEDEIEITEASTRIIHLSGTYVWNGSNQILLNAINSNDDLFSHWYHSVGEWVKNSSVTQYNNTQYDDGTNLVNLLPNKYTVNWIYRCACKDNKFAIVLGNEFYGSLEDAIYATPWKPSELPQPMITQALLIGRIIVKNGDDTASKIDSANYNVFRAMSLVKI